MKFLGLIWAGLWRKKTRTILTILSIIAAFLLFGLLQGVNKGFDNVVSSLNGDRLFTSSKYNTVEGLPIKYAKQIATVKGVADITYFTFFGGYYQDKRNNIAVFAVDVPVTFKLYKEFKIPQEQVDAMRKVRDGALISKDLVAKYGWKIGDNVPISTSIWIKKDGRADYTFRIVGIFDPTSLATTGSNSVYINYDYLDEARRFGNGYVHYFIVGIDDRNRAEEVSRNIDALFVNSGDETRTDTEQVFLANQIKQLADINFIVTAIIGAVLFTLLFLTSNMMMQSMSERTPEFAVMKTLGFGNGTVSTLVVFEAVLLCVVSALLGLGLARLAFIPLTNFMGSLEFSPEVFYAGLLIAIGLAVASSLVPAWNIMRLSIVDALAKR